MKKSIFSIVLIMLAACLLLAACTPAPAEPGQPDQPDAPKAADAPLDCDWTLHIDQTIPVETDGMTVNYTLVLIAQKQGGTDVYGTYEGAAYIAQSLDASNLSNEVINVTGGFDIQAFGNNLSFEIQPYDIESYSHYGIGEDEAPIAPLVSYESMALISPEMTGSGVLNPFVTGIQGEQAGYEAQASGTEAVTMKILINSGKAQVYVPSFQISHSFEGWVTGHPKGDSTLFEDGMDRIEELSAQPETDASADDMLGGLDGLMGGMGDMGNNLALPAAFPTDDFPIMQGANIFNVFEKQETKTVRIMYGIKTAYDDVVAFYAPVVEKMKTDAIPIDDGVMYMGDMSGYRSVMLMIAKDKSGTYGITVYIEYTEK